MTRRGVVCVRMVNVRYVMKVLWKILCISCCTVESLQVIEEVGVIEGTEEWMAEWRNNGGEGRVGLLLGRSVAGVKEKLLVRIDRVVMANVLKWWEQSKIFDIWYFIPCLWHP